MILTNFAKSLRGAKIARRRLLSALNCSPYGPCSIKPRSGCLWVLPLANNRSGSGRVVYPGNSIMVRPNGPLICKGDSDITLLNADDEIIIKDKEFALCRCGMSKNKPFCDGSHKSREEDMPQAFVDERDEDIQGLDGDLTIMVKANAMYSE